MLLLLVLVMPLGPCAAGWASVATNGNFDSGTFTCATDSSGGAWCWGRYVEPATGVLIAVPELISPAPVRVPLEGNWTGLSTGKYRACGVQADGAAYCWGQNTYGQLGTGDLEDRPLPTQVLAAGPFGTIAPGSSSSSCGALADGGLYMWGSLGVFEAGLTAPEPVNDSEAEEGQRSVSQLGSMGEYCWAVGTNGSIFHANRDASDPGTSRVLPGAGGGWAAVQGVLASKTTSYEYCGVEYWGLTDNICALDVEGRAFCQGQGGRGFLGNGGTQDSCDALVPVSGGHSWRSLSVAYDYACGVTTEGGALCWGSNQDGKLGSGPGSSAIIVTEPVPVAEPAGDASAWVHLSTGDAHACGVKASGRLYCWGSNRDGRLGTAAVPVGGSSNTPVEVALPGGAAAAPAGSQEGAAAAPGAAPAPAGGSGAPAALPGPLMLDPGSSASKAVPSALVLAGALLAVLAATGF